MTVFARLEHRAHLRYTSASKLNREMPVATLRQPAFETAPIVVRKARPEDAPVCGRICYDAFTKISTDHAFPPGFFSRRDFSIALDESGAIALSSVPA